MKSSPERSRFHLAVLLLVVILLVVISLAFSWSINSRMTNTHLEFRTGDPIALLAEANRLSWLGNWYAAGPLYQQAEVRFHANGDTGNEIYARIGRIRGQALNVPLDRSLLLLNHELDSPVV